MTVTVGHSYNSVKSQFFFFSDAIRIDFLSDFLHFLSDLLSDFLSDLLSSHEGSTLRPAELN